ncbi:MAG: glycoside hydrolase family 99-like domain-containing protein [Limnospira sp. PMC 1234.20]|uniref:glycoside hydrolase family 99-like domain-containing protein n=1 Tax=Limnospira sp. PMC 1234.20 TaxID=2981032 RepID=UPI0028E0AB89|nr:glycoside hydrolase family 99-like domain-containing protein [Limnospira sp. PMC 1234.20]MDT9270895.1 glycoside hydrolase family 99-like domain-containing protein [Limnospira sp. PMC 1234.20]
MTSTVDNSSLEIANKLLQQGKIQEAVAEYRRGIELTPDLSWHHYYLGEALTQLEDWEGAVSAYRQAISLGSNYLCYYRLGVALVKLERWDEAIEVLNQGLELKPDYYKFYLPLGQALVHQQHWEPAMEAYRKAVALKPGVAEFNLQLGYLLRRHRRFQEAAGYLQRAVDFQGDDPQLQLALGVALVEGGTDLDRAEGCLRRTLELQPDQGEAYFYLGKLCQRRDQLQEALGFYRRCGELSPGVDSALAVAAVLEKLGRPTEAVDQYRQVVLEFGECGPASLGLGRALAELERPVEAVVEWRRAVKLGVETPEVHRLLAETLVELGRWSEVVEHWKWLLERYPGAAHWRRRLALALMGLGRWTEAAAQWGEYWRVAPGSGRCPVVDFRPQKKTHGEIDHSQELSITGDLTVEFWLYLRDWPKSWTEIISKFVSDEQNEFCFRLKDDQKGQWYYGKGDGCSTSINWVPKKDIRLHEWVHVACVRKVGQYGRIYFNGVLRREDDWSGESEAAGTEAPVRLMGSPQWQRFHDGKLSEVRLWNRALSGDEIREGMCEGLTGEEPGLVGLWHGDESDEGVLVDAVGHHHGRLVMAADAGKERPRVGVCGWELSHNAAGRAYTLAQLYGGFAEVELIGCLFPKYGGQVWEPIRGGEIRCHTIRVEDEGRFVEQALGLVLAHPYEVVHLSKPRMPNIIFGLLYKLVWGARVIVDIDDEELIFVRASEPVDLRELLESGEGLPKWKHLQGKEWTRIAVGLVREFDGVTVSNRALQERYGGVVIRHARDEARFVPSADLKRRSRERFGIAQDKKVVLFFGTPRKHKGLVTTARALGSLGRKDVVFAIIGDFPDGKLKEELQGIPGVDYVFVGNQPFESIPDVVAVGDICVLLQDVGSEVSQFQIPAKLSDALGMGLVVLLSETAAVADVIESGAVVPVAEGDLPAVLGRVLSDEAECNKFRVRGRELLAAEFGFGVNGSRLAAVMDEVRSGVGVLSDELNLLLAGFPAVGSVWQHWGEGVLETRRLRPVGQGVSIIVLSWNGAGLLRRLLSSFFATNTYFPVEFIIIDHGSEDNTAEVVRQQAIKGDVRYINRGANFSFSDSCNYGAGLAKHPYLLFLNNDIVFSSDVLPLAVSRLDDATIGAVGVRLDDEPSSLPKGKKPGVHHTGIEFVWNEKRGYFQPEQIRHGSLKDYLANATAEGDFFPAVTGAFLLCRKGDLERVGGFSLDYDYGLEDIDFCLRLGRDLQKRCYCINEVSLQHLEGATRQGGNQKERREVRENNHQLFKNRWYDSTKLQASYKTSSINQFSGLMNPNPVFNLLQHDLNCKIKRHPFRIPGISDQFQEKIPKINFQEMQEEFIPHTHASPVDSIIKPIAHYLPQFHPFPENDEWWGKGFTEWTNVGKSKPCYRGHHQPHCPIHFGYYDLRVPTVLEEQANLAKEYGIYGFNFYFYWFAGKILMEMPLKSFIKNKKIDLKFCLTWANENWTRRWDGQENDILIAQEHSDDDSLKFIRHLIQYFKDDRYIKINGKPLLIIYRARIIPNIKKVAKLWRQEVELNEFPGLYLVSAQTFGIRDPREFGFDASVEFPPHTVSSPEINDLFSDLLHDFSGRIYSYDEAVNNEVRKANPDYKLFRSAMLSWDNTARKGKSSHIFDGFTLTRYTQWLRSLCFSTINNKNLSSEESFVFINAWNEWAEGTHLEPDNLYGYGYLEATRRVVNDFDASIIRKLSDQKLQKNNNYALIIHIHYFDLWEEIREILKTLHGFDIYVTTTSSALAEQIKCDFDSAFVIFVENRGRDILPFIEVLRLTHAFGYEVCCKIHSKKSLYRADGHKIRHELFSSLLPPDRDIVSHVCSRFHKNDKLGLIVPKKYFIPHKSHNMLYNQEIVERLCKKMEIQFNPSYFPAGSMFWFRPRALSRLLLLGASDFDVESGLCDGTTAHAVERLFCTVSHCIGYNTDVI